MKTGARGFTLLEVMVATVILGVAVVGLVSGISGALRNASRLTSYDRAVPMARQRMNELLLDDRMPRGVEVDGNFDPSQTGGIPAGWRARVSTFEKPPAAVPGQTAIDRIQLQIWWMSGAERRTFTLEGYKPHMLVAADILQGSPQ
jgi:general secretion pathway protein I